MTTLTIMGGAESFVAGSKTAFGYRRLKEWYAQDPVGFAGHFSSSSDGPGLKELCMMSNGELSTVVVKHMHLASITIHLLGYFHDLVAQLYVRAVDDYFARNPYEKVRMAFVETREPKPANYPPAMTRLSQMSWTGYVNTMKGFCPFEPAVRLRQLLSFPISKFAKLEIQDINMPSPPSQSGQSRQLKKITRGGAAPTVKDLYIRVLELEPVIQQWEEYYVEMAKRLDVVCEKIKHSLASA